MRRRCGNGDHTPDPDLENFKASLRVCLTAAASARATEGVASIAATVSVVAPSARAADNCELNHLAALAARVQLVPG